MLTSHYQMLDIPKNNLKNSLEYNYRKNGVLTINNVVMYKVHNFKPRPINLAN